MKKIMTVAATLLAGTILGAQARPQPGTKLPLAQVDAQMFHVSAGKRLKPAAWPNGARVAVGLSFELVGQRRQGQHPPAAVPARARHATVPARPPSVTTGSPPACQACIPPSTLRASTPTCSR